MERVKNVRDTIYLLIFSKPRYALEVSKLIYGRENKRVFAEIKQLLNDNWIKEFTVDIDIEDRRAIQRKYYRALSDPIVRYVQNTSFKLMLLEHEKEEFLKHFLKLILSSQAFRYWIKNNIPKNFKTISINAFDFILTFVDMLFFIHDNNPNLKQQHKNVRDSQSYYNALEKQRKNKEFNREENLSKVLELFYGNTISEDDKKEILADIHHLFVIPNIPEERVGFSDFGSLFYMTDSLSLDINKLFST